jgi:hypothetical protein
MSGTFPTTPVPSEIRIRSIQPTLVSVAHSLKRTVRTRGGQRWGITARWPRTTRALFAPIWAMVVKQQGRWDTFTWVLPKYGVPQGTWPTSGTINVDGASQTGTTLNIKGLTAGQTGIAKAGDFFVAAGASKVYMVTADANSDGSGKAALSIMPKLVASPADNAALTYTSVPFTLALAEDMNEFGASSPAGMTLGFELELVEVY